MNYSAIRAIFCNSGQQSKAKLRFYRGVCVLQKFQQSRHGDGRFCFNRGSLHKCCSRLVEAFLEPFTQLLAGILLDVRIGVDQQIGTGTGSQQTFQLAKRYTSGAQTWVRTITKPVAGTIRVALGMVEQMSGWTVDTTTGVVTFTTAPAGGVAVRAGFEFDVPVRFDSDTLDVTLDFERLGSITAIPLLEIRR